MLKYIKKFNTHADYESFISDDFIKPNVSLCVEENEVHYNSIETRIVVKYDVNANNETKLYTYLNEEDIYSVLGIDMFDEIEIDGTVVNITDIDNAQGTYVFTDAGEHIVKYTIKDPEFVGVEMEEQGSVPVITRIGATFNECKDIVSVYIPNSVTVIGRSFLGGCYNLKNIDIPVNVTSIGNSAFSNCNDLRNLFIPKKVSNIDDTAFEGCTFTSITVDSENTVYDSRNNCNAINETATNTLLLASSNTVIPNSIVKIGNRAFEKLGLTSINIPDSVTTIGESAFKDCVNLTNITVGNGLTDIKQCAFMGCSHLTGIELPSHMENIDSGVFERCNRLASIVIPEGITIINEGTFRSCNSLSNITLPNSLKHIDSDVFVGCSALTSITLPNGFLGISENVFYSSGVKTITSLATTAPEIYEITFKGIQTGGTLYVPQGSTGYDVWMGTGNYYLGKYNWTKVEN